MLHPSYSDLMKVVNSEVEEGNEPVVNSRYSIVLATAKRARQIIARQSKDDLDVLVVSKPLSKAVSELNEGKIKIVPEEEKEEPDYQLIRELLPLLKSAMEEMDVDTADAVIGQLNHFTYPEEGVKKVVEALGLAVTELDEEQTMAWAEELEQQLKRMEA